jgi:hypothetical protein
MAEFFTTKEKVYINSDGENQLFATCATPGTAALIADALKKRAPGESVARAMLGEHWAGGKGSDCKCSGCLAARVILDRC